MTTATRASSPRFRRPEARRGVALTADDVSILWHVYRHRVIDSASLYQLFPNRSRQVISRRLRKLWEGEFLDRPLSQNRKNSVRGGSDFLVYALAREGARLLQDEHDAPLGVSRWTQKNAELKPMAIQHHLSITRFMVRFASDVAMREGARLLYADELLPAETRQPGRGLANTIRADVPWPVPGRQQGTAPDQIFGLEMAGERQVFFLEIDQGTETIEPNERRLKSPRFWSDTSFLRKMLIYGAAFRCGAHKRQFGIPVFRVLTVTTTLGRVQVMQEAYQRHLTRGENKTPPGFFLFTDWGSIQAASGGLLGQALVNAAGNQVQLS